MRKIYMVLNTNNSNVAAEVISPYKHKLRIFQDENIYFKINVKTDTRPIQISLKLDEG